MRYHYVINSNFFLFNQFALWLGCDSSARRFGGILGQHLLRIELFDRILGQMLTDLIVWCLLCFIVIMIKRIERWNNLSWIRRVSHSNSRNFSLHHLWLFTLLKSRDCLFFILTLIWTQYEALNTAVVDFSSRGLVIDCMVKTNLATSQKRRFSHTALLELITWNFGRDLTDVILCHCFLHL